MSVSSIAKQQNSIGVHSNHLKLGIIGTANVGKSSLFNVLVDRENRKSPSENCLFRTIDPYIASFSPYDPVIDYVSDHLNISAVPASLTVVDTAGLVEGSFREGRGVGVSTLSSLQNVDLILHVLREFEDENVTHYRATVDPLKDLSIVNKEILYYDLDLIEAALTDLETIKHREFGGDYLTYQMNTLLKAWAVVAGSTRPVKEPLPRKAQSSKKLRPPLRVNGIPLRYGSWDFSERALLAEYKFISTKKVLYLVNMASRDYLRQVSLPSPTVTSIQQAVEIMAGEALRDTEIIPISLAFEENLRNIRTNEGMDAIHEYFAANPTHTSAKDTIVNLVHRNLGLIHFYTASEKEVKCWCVKQGKTIMECSAVVDVNIARNFLRGEVIAFADYERYKGDKLKLLMDGKLKSETKKYIVNDGDIIEFFTHVKK
eukprot:gene9083-10725_t